MRASALLQSLDPVGSGRGRVDHELHAGLVEDLEPVVIELEAARTRMIEAAARGDEWGDVSCFPQLGEPRRRREDVDDSGGLQMIVRQLLDAELIDGSALTCTGESLAEQVRRLDPPAPDGDVIHALRKPFKNTGGLRLLSGNLAPGGGAVVKVAGIERGLTDNVFVGTARLFDSERSLIEALERDGDSFEDNTMVVVRYEGPRGAPGMPELLKSTSRVTALCRQREITIGLPPCPSAAAC